MRKILLIIVCVFITNTIFSQKNVTLYFRNGDTLKVISHLNSGNSKIKYRENEDSKKITVNYKKITKAVQHYSNFNKTFVYKIKDGHQTPIILEQILTGKIHLFKMGFTRNSNFGGGMSMSSDHTEYYVSIDGSDIVTTFNASGLFIENGFRKKSRTIFNDCPEIIKNINNKTWKMKDIPQIVLFYNNECFKK
jgi:hypothetical protein